MFSTWTICISSWSIKPLKINLGGLLLTSPISSLAELKRGSPSWPLVEEHSMNMRSRPVNEIEKFQTQEELNRKETRGRYEEGQGCRGPLHALVCYKCDKGADFWGKHPSKEESCPNRFYDGTCRFCEEIGTEADANPAAFPKSPSGKTETAGRTRINPFR